MTPRIGQSTLGLVVLAAVLRTSLGAAGAAVLQNPERTMQHDDPVIQQALNVIGQPVNPVKVVGAREIGEIYARVRAGVPPAGLNAFRATGDASDPSIYVNRDSHVYQGAADTPSGLGLLKLAATLVHEQVHNSDGEFAAYRLQSDFVRSRLSGLPKRQQGEARRYLQGLDVRANGLGRAERAVRERALAAARF